MRGMGKDGKICIGKIIGPHGVRGLVKIESHTASPEDIFAYRPVTDESGAQIFKLTRRSVGADHFIAAIEGVADRGAAQALKGAALYVNRSALPQTGDDEYYHADLIGLCVRDAADQDVGFVETVHDYGAGTFLEIKPAKGKSFMLPLKKAFVPEIDLQQGFLRAEIPDGWLKEEKPKKEKIKRPPRLRGHDGGRAKEEGEK